MKELTFITGNADKARYLELWLDVPVSYHKLDLAEIQSLDLKEVVTYKASEAFRQLGQPVLVEDVALTFHALGRLPGTLVKWFLEEIGNDGICRLLDGYGDRSATAEIIYGLHDGTKIHYFDGKVKGSVAEQPHGTAGFGWNPVFIPDGTTKTYAELTDEQMKQHSFRALAIAKLRTFLDQGRQD